MTVKEIYEKIKNTIVECGGNLKYCDIHVESCIHSYCTSSENSKNSIIVNLYGKHHNEISIKNLSLDKTIELIKVYLKTN